MPVNSWTWVPVSTATAVGAAVFVPVGSFRFAAFGIRYVLPFEKYFAFMNAIYLNKRKCIGGLSVLRSSPCNGAPTIGLLHIQVQAAGTAASRMCIRILVASRRVFIHLESVALRFARIPNLCFQLPRGCLPFSVWTSYIGCSAAIPSPSASPPTAFPFGLQDKPCT